MPAEGGIMLDNLSAWHIVIVLGVVVLLASALVAVIVIAIRLARRQPAQTPGSTKPGGPPVPPEPTERP
jgi:hypothetical protein